jgi:hypothetical protein
MTNYKKLKSSKLQELLLTADEHEAIQIESVLRDRGVEFQRPVAKQDEAPARANAEAQSASPDEVGSVSEVLGEAAPETTEEEAKAKAEFDAKVEAATVNVGHKCQVVPFNTIDWVPGVIMGVVSDFQAGRISYAIKTEAGKKMLKSVDSKLIKISKETVDINTMKRSRPKGSSTAGRTEEDLQAAIKLALPNVGKQLVIDENHKARIDGLLLDRRTMRVMYKYKDPETGGQKFKTYADDIVLEDFANDADREHCAKYAASFKAGTPLTPEERKAKITASIERYKTQIAKWEAELEKLEAANAEEKAE